MNLNLAARYPPGVLPPRRRRALPTRRRRRVTAAVPLRLLFTAATAPLPLQGRPSRHPLHPAHARASRRLMFANRATAVPWICQMRRDAATTHGCVETFRHRLRCPPPRRSSRRPVSIPPPPATPGRASASAGHEITRCSQINHSCYVVPHAPATAQCRAPPRGNGHVCVAGGEARGLSRGPVA